MLVVNSSFASQANHGVVSLFLVLPDNFSAFSHAPEREKGRRKNNGGREGDDFAFLVSISRSCTVSSNKLVSLPHIPAYITVERVYVRFPLGLAKGPKQFLCSHRTERASFFRTLHLSSECFCSRDKYKFLSSFPFTFCLDPDDAKGMQEQRANLLD